MAMVPPRVSIPHQLPRLKDPTSLPSFHQFRLLEKTALRRSNAPSSTMITATSAVGMVARSRSTPADCRAATSPYIGLRCFRTAIVTVKAFIKTGFWALFAVEAGQIGRFAFQVTRAVQVAIVAIFWCGCFHESPPWVEFLQWVIFAKCVSFACRRPKNNHRERSAKREHPGRPTPRFFPR